LTIGSLRELNNTNVRNDHIHVVGLNNAHTAGLTGIVTLIASVDDSYIKFDGTASSFHSLSAQADNGIFVQVDLTTTVGGMYLDGDIEDSGSSDAAHTLQFSNNRLITAKTLITLESTTGTMQQAALTLQSGDGINLHTDSQSSSTGDVIVLNADMDSVHLGELSISTGNTFGTTDGDIQITAYDIDFDGSLNAGNAEVVIHGSRINHTYGFGIISNFSMFISDAELGRITSHGTINNVNVEQKAGLTFGNNFTGSMFLGGITENSTDSFGTLKLIATQNNHTKVIFDQETSYFNKGITIQSRQGGIEFKASTYTKASTVEVDVTNTYLTVHNDRVFSTNFQDLIITAIDVDLRQSGLLLAKGTPVVYDTPEIKIAQSSVGNRIEIHGTNFGYVRSAIGIVFDQGVETTTEYPLAVTNTLIVTDVKTDTTTKTGFLRVRVKRASIKSDIMIVGIFTTPVETPIVTPSVEELGSSAMYADVSGKNFGDAANETRVYIEGIANRLEYDGNVGLGSNLFESASTWAYNFTSTFFYTNLFHGFDTLISGLQDINAGPLFVVVTVQGVKSNMTQIATLIKKPLISNTNTSLIARSDGINRIEIAGIRFGDDGIAGIGVAISIGFSGQPPMPTGPSLEVALYTTVNNLAVIDLPQSTFASTGVLYAVVTRKRGPSDPVGIGVFTNAIDRPMVNYNNAERSASATTLLITGLGYTIPSDTRVYLQATNGVDGEHLGYVRTADYASNRFMVDSISGLNDPQNLGPLYAVVVIQGVKSETTLVATIIPIPIITVTMSAKVARSPKGNRLAILGSLFGTNTANVAVELFVLGTSFRYTSVVTTKENEIMLDTVADTTPASGFVTAIVWRSGGPSAPAIVGNITAFIEPPQIEASLQELSSSITMLNVTTANMGSIPADVRVFLTATNGTAGFQMAAVRSSPFDSKKLVLDLTGITDLNSGPLKAIVTVQSVKADEQVIAVVHRGSSDISWKSAARNRFVSSAISTLEFNATFTLSTETHIALSKVHSDCGFAPNASMISNGQILKRALSGGGGDTITLPSGAAGDMALEEGDYIICVCDNDEGSTVTNGVLYPGGCNHASEFEVLPHKLTIFGIPIFGEEEGTMDLRAITRSSPTYRLYGSGTKLFVTNDIVFASERGDHCGSIPLVNRTNETAFMYVRDPTRVGIIQLPNDVQLEAVSESMARTLTLCFTTQESGATVNDFVRLSAVLSIIPEPTNGLQTKTWFESNVHQLDFDMPEGIAGIGGDMIVLEPHDCTHSHARDIVQSFPITSSAKSTLQSGGVAREYAIAQGKFNELPSGVYRVCYATKSSAGDSVHDFRLLQKTIEIRPASAVAPTIDAADTVALGADIVVSWSSGNGLNAAVVSAGTWIGLYASKSCSSYNNNVHKCYLASHALPVNTTSGEVRFTQKEYNEAGEYDVRYFEGNTRHGQGIVCRGLKQIKETYLQCTLEAAAVSRVIFVDPEEPTPTNPNAPGLEAVFDTGDESFEIGGQRFM